MSTRRAHVTPSASTEVFVGHGSTMVTVLSGNNPTLIFLPRHVPWPGRLSKSVASVFSDSLSVSLCLPASLKSMLASLLRKSDCFSSPKSNTRISCDRVMSSAFSSVEFARLLLRLLPHDSTDSRPHSQTACNKATRGDGCTNVVSTIVFGDVFVR